MKNILIGALAIALAVVIYKGNTDTKIAAPQEITPLETLSLEDVSINNNESTQPENATSLVLPQYINPATGSSWPPQVITTSETFACSPTTNEIESIYLKNINGNEYCVTEKREGTAGSRFISFIYKKAVPQGTWSTSFVLQLMSCTNLENSEVASCQQGQDNFFDDLDNFISNL